MTALLDLNDRAVTDDDRKCAVAFKEGNIHLEREIKKQLREERELKQIERHKEFMGMIQEARAAKMKEELKAKKQRSLTLEEKLAQAKKDKKSAEEDKSDEMIFQRVETDDSGSKYVPIKKSQVDLEKAEKLIKEIET